MSFWQKYTKTKFSDKMGQLVITKHIDNDDFPSSPYIAEWQSPISSPVEKDCAESRSACDTYPWVDLYMKDGTEHVSVTVVGISRDDGLSKLNKAVHRFLTESGEADTKSTRTSRILIKNRLSGRVEEQK